MDQIVEWPSKWNCDEHFEALFNTSSVVNSTVIHSVCFPQTLIPPQISATQLPVRPCWPLVSNCPGTPPLNLTVPVDYETLVVNCPMYGISQVASSTDVRSLQECVLHVHTASERNLILSLLDAIPARGN